MRMQTLVLHAEWTCVQATVCSSCATQYLQIGQLGRCLKVETLALHAGSYVWSCHLVQQLWLPVHTQP